MNRFIRPSLNERIVKYSYRRRKGCNQSVENGFLIRKHLVDELITCKSVQDVRWVSSESFVVLGKNKVTGPEPLNASSSPA